MAKNSIRDYSNVNSSNSDIQSIDISEGCSPAGINNAIREVMADLKDVSTGAVALESPAADSLTVTGDLTVDTNTLYVDSTNNRVGIGTSSTNYGKFTVQNTDGTGKVLLDSYQSVPTTENVMAIYADASNGYIESYNNGYKNIIIAGSGGNVGIGTSSPNDSLHVKAASNAGLTIQSASNTAGTYAELGFLTGSTDSDPVNVAIRADRAASFNDTALSFHTGGTSLTGRMWLNGSGQLLVNTNNPLANSSSAKLQVYGATGISAGFQSDNAGQQTLSVWNAGNSGTRYFVWFESSSGRSAVGSITSNGSSTAYNTTSDYRLKTAVTYDWNATTRLKQLRPARFEWISDGDDAVPVDGFLAHEVQSVVPEAITGTKDGMRDEEYQVSAATGDIYTPAIEAVLDEDGNEVTPAVAEVIHSTDVERPEELAEGQQWRETTAAVMGTRSVPDYQGIDQSKLVPLLVKTIQELEARITALEAN